MKIKLDENLSRHIKYPLERLGHKAMTVEEEKLLGKSDEDVAFAAKGENRMVFTLDLEFADLRKYPPGSHPGIILFRPRSMGPGVVNQFILAFAQETNLDELTKCVVVVDPHQTRIRRPPIDAGPAQWEEIPL